MVYINLNLRPTLKVVRFVLWGMAPARDAAGKNSVGQGGAAVSGSTHAYCYEPRECVECGVLQLRGLLSVSHAQSVLYWLDPWAYR